MDDFSNMKLGADLISALNSANVIDNVTVENTTDFDHRKLGGVGASEVGKLFTSKGLDAKTAHTFAYEKALELIRGYKDYISTDATLHGINSEIDAYRDVIIKKYPNAELRSDVSIFLQEKENYCYWVTPDVTDESIRITIDSKCPKTPETYHRNIANVLPSYKAQLQMQMLGTGHEKGALLFYLTNDKTDEFGNKQEYDIPINDRNHFVYFDADTEFQEQIVDRINSFFPMRDAIKATLDDAPVISDRELFYLCQEKTVCQFKKNNNLLIWYGRTVKCRETYYTFKD